DRVAHRGTLCPPRLPSLRDSFGASRRTGRSPQPRRHPNRDSLPDPMSPAAGLPALLARSREPPSHRESCEGDSQHSSLPRADLESAPVHLRHDHRFSKASKGKIGLRALVTGGAGLIGSHIVDKLLARGWEVRILDSLELPCHLKGKPRWVPKDAEFIHGAVEDPRALEPALRGVDAVFHQAAYQGFLPSYSRFWTVNGGGTALIYELIVAKSLPVKKVVIASSQAVYGEGKYQCPTHGEVAPPPRLEEDLRRSDWEHRCRECSLVLQPTPTNEDVLDPRTMYAQSKRAQETIGLELGKTYQIPTVALRYAITQGPRQSIYHAYSGVCSIFSTRIVNNLPPIIYEDGHQLRDYVYVGDVADANLFVF